MPSERILIVDDEETIREIVSSMLTSANFNCRQAASGMEALALLDSGEEFELMLSDLMMANLDGIGLLEKTKERFPDMPVVMVTAVHDISVALAALRNGAYDYLLKPFEREQLLATVRRALENRRLKLENRDYLTNMELLVETRPEQGTVMREHCYHGYQIFKKMPFLVEAAEIVYCHQERFDGAGYPRGLKGEQIPLGARMFSLADTLDAITSNRPYRAAQTVEAAREEIERWAGRQFDPEIVRTFMSMDKNIWSDLRKEIDAQIHRFAYSVKSSS